MNTGSQFVMEGVKNLVLKQHVSKMFSGVTETLTKTLRLPPEINWSFQANKKKSLGVVSVQSSISFFLPISKH